MKAKDDKGKGKAKSKNIKHENMKRQRAKA
jgi:hypothetical protein